MKEKYKSFFKELFISVALSLYPISYLYEVNYDKLLFKQTALPFLIVSSTALVVFLFLKSICLIKLRVNNIQLIIPIISIILFLYGFFFNLLFNQHYLTGFIRNRYLLPLALVVIALLVYFLALIKNKIALQTLLSFLIILNVIPYLSMFFQISKYKQTPKSQIEINNVKNSNINSKDPDIYYIILDMYPSEKVLKCYWKFDNSKFLSHIINLGFKVFPDSSCTSFKSYQKVQKKTIESKMLTKSFKEFLKGKTSLFKKNVYKYK